MLASGAGTGEQIGEPHHPEGLWTANPLVER
jgi:hypothetical protein